MTDSPAIRVPLDPKEQPVLDQLLSIRTSLELLRADKSTYVKSEDVIRLFNSLIDQVEVLNSLRSHNPLDQSRGLLLHSLSYPRVTRPETLVRHPLSDPAYVAHAYRNCLFTSFRVCTDFLQSTLSSTTASNLYP